MRELETVWHGALWREGPQPVRLAEEARKPSRVYVRKQAKLPTPAKAEVLAVIRTAGVITRQGAVEALSHRTYASVSTAIDRLEAEGLIQKLRRVQVNRNLAWLYRVREGQ